jgi:hypothetical protein
MGATPPQQPRLPTQKPAAYQLAIPPLAHGANAGADAANHEDVSPSFLYRHTPLPSTQFSNLDESTEVCKHDKHLYCDLATEGGLYSN